MRFFRPFSASGWLRPLSPRQAGSSRGVACRYRSARAVSTTSAVYSAIHPCPGFPRQHSWGSVHPSGHSRLARAAPSPVRPAPPELDVRPCLRSRFRFHRPSALQGFAPRGDRRRSHSVSLLQGLVSLLGFSLWDLAPSARHPPRRKCGLAPLPEQARQRPAPHRSGSRSPRCSAELPTAAVRPHPKVVGVAAARSPSIPTRRRLWLVTSRRPIVPTRRRLRLACRGDSRALPEGGAWCGTRCGLQCGPVVRSRHVFRIVKEHRDPLGDRCRADRKNNNCGDLWPQRPVSLEPAGVPNPS